VQVVLNRGSWQVPPIFSWLQKLGSVADDEMDRVFNMGIGMTLVVSAYYAENIRRMLADNGVESWIIGHATDGPQGVAWK
jgi:phosphoribosylaminoimidazole (AIR) synthetase